MNKFCEINSSVGWIDFMNPSGNLSNVNEIDIFDDFSFKILYFLHKIQ